MKKMLLAMATATLLSAGAAAQAQDYHDGDHHDQGYADHGDHGPGPGGPGGYDHGPDDHPPIHHWARGDHAPPEYWHHGHEVDWRQHHLRRPPHGYHWVQGDDQYALVGINTGIVNAVIDIR